MRILSRGGGQSWEQYWLNKFNVTQSQMALWIDTAKKVVGNNAENNAALIICEDDADPTAYSEFYSYLHSKGLPGVINIITSSIGVTDEQIAEMIANGMEIIPQSHLHTTDMSGWTDSQLRTELDLSNAVYAAKGLSTPTHWTAPAYNSFYPNVRRIGAEYYQTGRGGIYNPNNSWYSIDHSCLGAFSMAVALGDSTDVNAKKSLDIAQANNQILFVFVHTLNTADKVTRFQGFVDYAVASGIEIINRTQLFNRFQAHQGYYSELSESGVQDGAYVKQIFSKGTLGSKTGHIIFSDTLTNVTAPKADALINTYNYKVSFLTDTTDSAFAYAVSNSTVRAILVALGINNLQKLFDYVGSATDYLNKSIVSTLLNIGIEYHVSIKRINLGINTITGTIPREIGNCKRLYDLVASSNQITGDIPIEISKLVDLHIFNLTSNLLTGYEKGAFANNLCYLNTISLANNYLSIEAVDDILLDVRDMVELNKDYVGTYDYILTPSYSINLGGRYNQAPSGASGNPATGLGAKYQLENAIAELGSDNNWIISVNEGTPTTEPSNYNGLIFWLDPAIGITKDGSNKVSQAQDISTTHNHLTQTNATYQPTWVDAQCNGLPIIRGATSQLNTDTTGYILSRTGACIFLVYKPNIIDANARSIFNHSYSNSYDLCYINWNGGGLLRMSARDASDWCNANYAFSTSNYYIIEISANGGTVKTYLNGNLLDTRIPTGNFNINKMLGRSAATAFAGDVAEIIIYNELRSDADRLAIRNYLNTKFAIY